MTKMLDPPYGPARTLSTTTTAKLARRMLGASRVVAGCLPTGFYSSSALDIMLLLHVAEEDARYLDVADLMPLGKSGPAITNRWVAVLEQQGLIDRKGEMLALSTHGHHVVTDLLEKLYDVQRALD